MLPDRSLIISEMQPFDRVQSKLEVGEIFDVENSNQCPNHQGINQPSIPIISQNDRSCPED